MPDAAGRQADAESCWLVACGTGDAPALWAFRGLSRLLPRVELVTAEVLACSLRWQHRLDARGTRTTIELAGGQVIRHDRLNGVLNRLTAVPAIAFSGAQPCDREYAAEEMLALWASWLHSLPCPVINRPSGQFASPAWYPRSEWAWRASRAGLPIAPYRESSDDGSSEDARRLPLNSPGIRTVFVVGGRVVPAGLPESLRQASRRLALEAQVSLLAIGFRPLSDGGWVCLFADAFPDLRIGGHALLQALASALTDGRA